MAAREEDLGPIIGPKGDKGDTIFNLEVDTAGDLWVVYADGSTPPELEYEDDTGDLYLIVPD